MIVKKFHFLFFATLLSVVSYAQEEIPSINHGFFNLGIGYGFTSFQGDLSNDQKKSALNNFRGAFKLSLEKRFGKIMGVGLDASLGKIAQNERTLARNLNFESSFTQFGLNLSAHFDTKSTTHLAPFISAGVAFISYSPTSDLQDANGKTYYYWEDGQIRDLPEFDADGNKIKANEDAAEIIRRDYSYETSLDKSLSADSTALSTSGLVIPISLGFKFKITEYLDARLSGTYNLTMTDHIDAYQDGGNDAYFKSSFSLTYTFANRIETAEEKYYTGVDFESLAVDDHDEDGVPDFNDKCSHTPPGETVDEFGCPLDTDKDGVPDYLDKQENTRPGSVVNRYGVALTDQDIFEQRLRRDSVFAKRVEKLYEAPSEEGLEEIGKQIQRGQLGKTSAMPAEYRFADFNNDGLLQSKEIMNCIDGFFDGSIDTTVGTIMEVIDYFFEQ